MSWQELVGQASGAIPNATAVDRLKLFLSTTLRLKGRNSVGGITTIGNNWSSGAGAPSGGEDGDFYFKTVDPPEIYENQSDVWTLIVTLSDYTSEQAQDAVGGILVDTASVNLTYDDGTPAITADVIHGGVNHNALLNYVSDQHVAHTGVTITAGAGLTGGGDISASRTINLASAASTLTITADNTEVTYGTAANTAAQGNDTRIVNAVQTSRTVTAGAGMTGGGALSADITLNVVAANATLVVNADSIERGAISGVVTIAAGSNTSTHTSSTGTGATVLADSPALTGNPTAPTATLGDSDTSIATTAFVNAEIANDAPNVTLTAVGSSPNANAASLSGQALTLQPASASFPGLLEAADLLTINAVQGRNSSLAVPRVFRPGEFISAGTYDPTGASNSTASFAAMKAAHLAFNDRSAIELPPGVFTVDNSVFTGFGNGSCGIKGPGRGFCVLIPSSAGDFITLPAGLTGSDAFQVEGFTIYNTSGTPFASGCGINVNGCDGAQIRDMTYIDLFKDVRINGAAIKVWNTGTLHFQTNGNASSVGIEVDNGDAGDTYLSDIVMSNGGATRRRACIEIIESGHYRISDSNLTGSAKGILIAPTGTKDVNFGFHTNVLCDSNTTNGMDLNCGATAVIKNIKSVNSWYSGTTSGGGAGVRTQGAGGTLNGITFSCDRFLNNQTHGFQHDYGTDFRWDSCDMKGNNAAGTAAPTPPAVGNSGLFVGAAVSNWSVNGGKYGGTDTVPTAANQDWGIFVTAGAGNNIKVAADDLSGNRTGPIVFDCTGVSCFLNGCPGLAANYARGASSAAITTVITLGNILIPKNSQRVGTTYRLTAYYTHSSTGTQTFTARYGSATDPVGSAATNTVISTAVSAASVANGFGKIEFMLTVTARGTGTAGNIQGHGIGHQGSATSVAVSYTATAAARANGVGFLGIATDADRYLTIAGASGTASLSVHNTTIEVMNY